jgi:hypothetical protein
VPWQIWTVVAALVFVQVNYRDLHEEDNRLSKRLSRPEVLFAKNSLWIETIRNEPRIFIIHNLISQAECEHLISLAKEKGLQVINIAFPA